jgi:hypothetical protein
LSSLSLPRHIQLSKLPSWYKNTCGPQQAKKEKKELCHINEKRKQENEWTILKRRRNNQASTFNTANLVPLGSRHLTSFRRGKPHKHRLSSSCHDHRLGKVSVFQRIICPHQKVSQMFSSGFHQHGIDHHQKLPAKNRVWRRKSWTSISPNSNQALASEQADPEVQKSPMFPEVPGNSSLNSEGLLLSV